MLKLSYVKYLPLLWMSALGQLYDKWKVLVTQQNFGFAIILTRRVLNSNHRRNLSLLGGGGRKF